MTTSSSHLRDALRKVAEIDFTEEEARALAAVISDDDDVGGFAKLGPGQNETFSVSVSPFGRPSVKMGDPTGGQAKLGPGQNETYRLAFEF